MVSARSLVHQASGRLNRMATGADGGGSMRQGVVTAAVIGFVGTIVAAVLTIMFGKNELPDINIHVPPNPPVTVPDQNPPARGFTGTVNNTGGFGVYIYERPSLAARVIGQFPNGAQITIVCTAHGDPVINSQGQTSTLWDKTGTGYVPDVVVDTGTNEPTMPGC